MSASTESPFPDVGPLEPDERVGTVLGDRYRLDALLGEGGMGRVYQAEHVLMRKRLAVKILHRELTTVPEVVARFEREAMAAANIDHPNVAAATDFGKLPDGAVFLVLEFVSGTNLRDEIAKGPIPVERALHVVRQIAAALGAAHVLDIVHRDLKPENVMLIEKGGDGDFVKVLDFGIAKVPIGESSQGRGSPITKVGMVFGTPEYMAPEQALGQPVDGRADLYALGVILYEMIAGVRPFSSKSPVGILGQQLSKPPPSFHERSPGLVVPPAVEALVVKLLAKEATERFQTATDVVQAIDLLLAPIPGRGAHRFTMQTGSPNAVVAPRVASIPDLEPPAISDFELPSSPGASSPLLSPAPVDILSADDELVSSPDSADVTGWPAPSSALAGRAPEGSQPSLPDFATTGTGSFPSPNRPTTSSGESVLDRGLSRGADLLRAAYSWIDDRRSRLPPGARDALRDVPTPAFLWTAVALLAGSVVALLALVISLATRDAPKPGPVASAGRVEAPPSVVPAPSFGEPAPGIAAEIRAAKAKGPGALAELAQKHPKEPEVLIELAGAQSAAKQHADAVGTVGKLLGVAPDRFKDPRLASVLKDAAQATESADATFALLEGPMGPSGADVVYELATGEDVRRETRARAERVMTTKRFEQIASAPLFAAVLLRQARSCQQRYGLLLRAKNVGDRRALEYLHSFEKTTTCGSDPKAECNACLAADDRLKQAILAIEKRNRN